MLCSDLDCGGLVTEAMAGKKMEIKVASVDKIASPASGTIMYRQDMQKTVEQIFTSLERQCASRNTWESAMYLIEGQMIQET